MPVEYLFGLDKEEKQGMILVAIEEHLYVDGWKLIDIFDEILSKDSDKFNICLALDDSIAIGISLCLDYGHICFFVKENYRNQGIGKNIFDKMKNNIKENFEFYGEKGCEGSKEFFSKIDVLLYD